MVGKTILHYRILEQLGQGGMGVVYKAEDTRLRRQVAIKFLPEYIAANSEERQRLMVEAQAAAALNHPNITQIYAIEESEARLFIVMEYIDGKELREMINIPLNPPSKGDFPPSHLNPPSKGNFPPSPPSKGAVTSPLEGGLRGVLNIAAQIAAGLQAAHQQGIIHRDIKSSNIMVSSAGVAKIMDFGLAKKLDTAGTPSDLTRPGTTLGTVAYMSPQQAQGREVDQRSDIWSFGVLLYEMITGQLPFKGEYDSATMYAIINEEPVPVQELRPDLPSALIHVVDRTLEKDPEDRYQSMDVIVRELRLLGRRSGSSARVPVAEPASAPQSGKRATVPVERRRLPAAVWWGIGLLLLAAMALWMVRRIHSPAAVNRPILVTVSQVTEDPGMENAPDISTDNNFVVYAKDGDLFMRRIGGTKVINLTATPELQESQPSFSPDGQMIAFTTNQNDGIFLMGATGESVRRLTDFGGNPSWFPDGKRIVFATESVGTPMGRSGTSEIWEVDVQSAATRRISSKDGVQPVVSPNGRRIAYWTLRAGGWRDIYTMSATGEDTAGVTRDPYTDWCPMWSADGRHLYFCSDRGGSFNIWRVAVDETSGKITGPPQPVTVPAALTGQMSLSRDGRKLVYTAIEARTNIMKIEFDPGSRKLIGQPQALTRGSRFFNSPHPSPDGQWVVFGSGHNPEDLYLMRSDGSELRQLTDDIFKDRGPRWSPDGKSILFYSDRSGNYEFWQIRPDGSGLEQLTDVADSLRNNYLPGWMPDGKSIFFMSAGGSRIVDLSVPRPQRAARRLPPISEGQYLEADDVSPDGQWMAGIATEATNVNFTEGIIIYNLHSRTYKRVTDFGYNCSWLADSRHLLVPRNDELCVVDLEGNFEVISQNQSVSFSSRPSPSADNRSLYFDLTEVEANIWLANLQE